jgi:fimbrial isopeptide formation D2 family protein/LPXTG-motif cell wall-anchored protein
MKHLKKLSALLIALVMVLAMGTVAFADPYDPGITVTNTNTSISIDGKEYKAYKLFDSKHSGTAYAYTMSTSNQFYSANLVSGEGVEANSLPALLRTYFNFTAVPGDTTKVNVTPKDGFNDVQARTLADAIEPFLEGKTATATATASGETAEIDLTATAAGLGYYIVTGVAAPKNNTTPAQEDVVSAVILTNENPSPVVQPKASIPTLDKKITKVEEGTTDVSSTDMLDTNGKAAVAKVGSTVSYEIAATTPELTGYDDYTYIIGDTISDGLTYDKTSFVLKIDGTEVDFVTSETTATDDNELIFAAGDKSFALTIPYDVLANYIAGKSVVLTYKCTVNASAVSYDYENNTANLEYSRTPYDDDTNHTPDKKTYVVDINLDVDKVAESASGQKLTGAKFKLYKGTSNTGNVWYKWDAANNKVDWVAEADADVFETTNGSFTTQVQGLDVGTYNFVETEAPEGYNLLSAPVVVVIEASESTDSVTYTATFNGKDAAMTNGTIDLTTEQQATAQPVAKGTIINNSGSILPSTGGIGRTIFLVTGSILLVGAGVLLVVRRRLSVR